VSSAWAEIPGHLLWGVFLFWSLQVFCSWQGYHSIKLLVVYGAPVMVVFLTIFLIWSRLEVGTWGPYFTSPPATPSIFVIAVLAIAANWITLAVNVADFTRLTDARSNAIGLVTGMVSGMLVVVVIGTASAS